MRPQHDLTSACVCFAWTSLPLCLCHFASHVSFPHTHSPTIFSFSIKAESDGLNLLMGRVCEGARSRLEWTRLDDKYDIAIQDGIRFAVPSGESRYIDACILGFGIVLTPSPLLN